MDVNTFEIPVEYNGQEMIFQAQLLDFGYVRKIKIDVCGQEVFLEKDDEGNFRAVLTNMQDEHKIDKQLVREIVQSLELMLK